MIVPEILWTICLEDGPKYSRFCQGDYYHIMICCSQTSDVIDVELLRVPLRRVPFSHGVRDKLVEIHVNELEYDVFNED